MAHEMTTHEFLAWAYDELDSGARRALYSIEEGPEAVRDRLAVLRDFSSRGPLIDEAADEMHYLALHERGEMWDRGPRALAEARRAVEARRTT